MSGVSEPVSNPLVLDYTITAYMQYNEQAMTMLTRLYTLLITNHRPRLLAARTCPAYRVFSTTTPLIQPQSRRLSRYRSG
jgi:hypothetical protein